MNTALPPAATPITIPSDPPLATMTNSVTKCHNAGLHLPHCKFKWVQMTQIFGLFYLQFK